MGYGKPPSRTQFKPGQSGNPRGRPCGSRNTKPSLSEERIKSLIIEEAYRTIAVVEKGRRVTIPMAAAVLRAVAMNAAKGNNRAATLFTTLLSKTEAENRKLAADAFASLSMLMLGDKLALWLMIAGILMAFGLWLNLSERHEHKHEEIEQEHRQVHDARHEHKHDHTCDRAP